MVTEKELITKRFNQNIDNKDFSYRVTAGEMNRFSAVYELGNKVYEKITTYCKEHNLKPKYEALSEICQIDESSMKKSCSGTQRITRTFLYKLAVGLNMSIDEANEYFILCGGKLDTDNLEDYICLKALEDKDDIEFFIDQFNEYTRRFDKLLKSDKLTKLHALKKG